MEAPAGLIVEGTTLLAASERNERRATPQPGAKGASPFYNPGMALNRDLSVLLAVAEAKRRRRAIDVADALCGAGARSLRWANEVDAVQVFANDASDVAVRHVTDQASRLGVAPRITPCASDAHAFLASRRFDLVDIDPFGSPAPFLDAAVRATRHEGVLCLTATDTAALAGRSRAACARRYDAHHGLHARPWRAEVGLRILAGAVVRAAARHERACDVLLSVARNHWMRVVVRLRDGALRADEALGMLRYAQGDDHGRLVEGRPVDEGEREVRHGRAGAVAFAGPLWGGPLHDAQTIQALREAAMGRTLAHGPELADLWPVLAQEADPRTPAFWVRPDDFVARMGSHAPRRDRMMEALTALGSVAARTHLDPQGIRTDADEATWAKAWKAVRR